MKWNRNSWVGVAVVIATLMPSLLALSNMWKWNDAKVQAYDIVKAGYEIKSADDGDLKYAARAYVEVSKTVCQAINYLEGMPQNVEYDSPLDHVRGRYFDAALPFIDTFEGPVCGHSSDGRIVFKRLGSNLGLYQK